MRQTTGLGIGTGSAGKSCSARNERAGDDELGLMRCVRSPRRCSSGSRLLPTPMACPPPLHRSSSVSVRIVWRAKCSKQAALCSFRRKQAHPHSLPRRSLPRAGWESRPGQGDRLRAAGPMTYESRRRRSDTSINVCIKIRGKLCGAEQNFKQQTQTMTALFALRSKGAWEMGCGESCVMCEMLDVLDAGCETHTARLPFFASALLRRTSPSLFSRPAQACLCQYFNMSPWISMPN